jgi:hypothetical protein
VNERSIRFAYTKGSLASTKAERGSLHDTPHGQAKLAETGRSGISVGALKTLQKLQLAGGAGRADSADGVARTGLV